MLRLSRSRSFVVLRLALVLSLAVSPSFSATAGSFADGGSTQISAMMVSFVSWLLTGLSCNIFCFVFVDVCWKYGEGVYPRQG